MGLTCINSGSHLLFYCIQSPKVEFFHNYTYEFKKFGFIDVLGSKSVLFLVGRTQFGYHIYNGMLPSFLCSLVFISSLGPSFLVSTYKITTCFCILNFFHCFHCHLCIALVHLAPLFCFNGVCSKVQILKYCNFDNQNHDTKLWLYPILCIVNCFHFSRVFIIMAFESNTFKPREHQHPWSQMWNPKTMNKRQRVKLEKAS